MTGEIDLMKSAKAVAKEILSIPSFNNPSDDIFSEEKNGFKKLQKSFLLIAGSTTEKLSGDRIS